MANKIPADPSRPDTAPAQQQPNEVRNWTLFEHALEGILIADADGRYLDANPGMCRMLDYSRDELIGMHIRTLLSHPRFSTSLRR